ncbi:hypothetical protein [Desulfobacula toluolica]|uniref:Uncharacterized protein n=1 Tax=Desulfobacula toluolica (strain DSM 7467 / Tol2) TaxID=651182 RepID=K0NM95_DESTT|nr:hypothetical protein [Desulfobacula toluolica]CCK81143.1 uncharacterized protein TOL2_C29840 [Desulfobacula toluolica Tol2]
MGKAKRLKSLRKQKESKQNRMTQEQAEKMLYGHELVPLTDPLIKKLVQEQGMPEKDLKDLQAQGAKYSPERNSFFFPPEMEWYD